MTPKSVWSFDEILGFVEKLGPADSRRTFGFDGKLLETYVAWAQRFGFLFLESGEYGISGLGVAYPVKTRFNQSKEWFYSFKDVPVDGNEKGCDLCVMDLVAQTPKARNAVIDRFRSRYPDWQERKKYALIRGVPREITNKHINTLYKHGLSINFGTSG